ncbi:MAG: TetR/AcrR family transcriptional regulator [Acidobacteriota bacterium]
MEPTGPKRRKPGERRIESLLGAAECVFAELGYQRATTNHIAERAGASPGTLYQFFPNKKAIAEMLAARYAAELEAVLEKVLDRKQAHGPLHAVIGAVVDAMVRFQYRHPAFPAIFEAEFASTELGHTLRARTVERLKSLMKERAPCLAAARIEAAAEICTLAFHGVQPLLYSKNRAHSMRISRELKLMLERYLAPLVGE